MFCAVSVVAVSVLTRGISAVAVFVIGDVEVISVSMSDENIPAALFSTSCHSISPHPEKNVAVEV